MKIDDEIKGSFSNGYHRALVNILFTHNNLVNRISQDLTSHNITRQQYNVLRILRGQYPNPVPVSLIKDRMLDKMSDASRIIDRLKKKGLIIKSIRSEDRRAADILLSKNGILLLEELDPRMSDYNNLQSNLTEEEANQLSDLLDKIRG